MFVAVLLTGDRFCSEYIAIAKGESIAHPLLYFSPATCLAEPRTPNITRDWSGSGITGSMVIAVRQTPFCAVLEQMLSLWARISCQLFSGSTVMAHAYLLSTEDSRVAMTCTWSVIEAVEVSSLLRGTEFFISSDHQLLLLGIIHVLPITTRCIGIKAWKF